MTNAARLQQEARMDRFGLKIAARLNDQALPHDISERLRVARQQAVAQRKRDLQTASSTQTAHSVSYSGGAAALGGLPGGLPGEGLGWFGKLANALPLLALVAGLVFIHGAVNDERAMELAEVDLELLTDDLPPSAHTDPGFAQFLKFGPPSATDSAL
jgi:hypothetical protein